jgi:hypothetical protein
MPRRTPKGRRTRSEARERSENRYGEMLEAAVASV